MKGITAFMVSWASIITLSFFFVLNSCWFKKTNKGVQYEEIENLYDKPNKTMKLRLDWYSVTFEGFNMIDNDQIKEIILDEEEEENEKIEDEKTEEEKRQDKVRKIRKKEMFFKDPLTGKQRKLSFNEAGRNFTICVFIFSIQTMVPITLLAEIYKRKEE